MDIFNSAERQVICVSNNDLGMFGFGEDASLLTIGKKYTVKKVRVHSWHTMVTLAEFPDMQFNSVHFEEVE